MQRQSTHEDDGHGESSQAQRDWAFVDWAQHSSRSEHLAARLGMRLIRNFKPRRSMLSLPYKYAFQFVKTAHDLARVRPRRVVCMSPSPLTALPVWIYCNVSGAEFAIDAHTGAFLGRPWDRFPWFQRFFTKRALMTIVTNEGMARIVEQAGGRPVIVPDVPTELESGGTVAMPRGFNVLFVASFGLDEPVDVVLEAARRLPHVTFHITGRPSKVWRAAIADKPSNVRMTGFLSREDYLASITAADVVLALTTRDHTMQRAAYESIYLGTPVVVSDWSVLRDNFDTAAVFTRNDPGSLVHAVERAAGEIDSLRTGARALRQSKLARWRKNQVELERRLSAPREGVTT